MTHVEAFIGLGIIGMVLLVIVGGIYVLMG